MLYSCSGARPEQSHVVMVNTEHRYMAIALSRAIHTVMLPLTLALADGQCAGKTDVGSAS